MGSLNIKAFIILFIALGFALYLGIATATAQFEAISWVVGGMLLAVCLLLGKHVWILIPATLSLRGTLNFLPGSPAPWHLMTAVAAVFFLGGLALRRHPFRLNWGWMETILLLVGLTIAQAFVRAPVGFYALGGDVAGGKPYFLFAVAFVAYLVISLSEPDLRAFRWAVGLYIAFGVLDGLISAASQFWPSFGRFVLPAYSNVAFAQVMGSGLDLSEQRFGYIGQLGSLLGLVACTFWRPLAAIDLTKPWRALVAGLACILVPISGFRSLSGLLFVQFVVGSAVRRKWLDIAFIVLAALMLVSVLAIGGFVRSLPFGAQRVLSVLPIEVDSRARLQAEGSSEERFEMWRLALGTDRFIENKVLGDGFSLKAREVKAMSESLLGMPGQQASFIEHSMAMGSYHGFHVETIRYTGVAGLLAATAALVVFMVHAWRNIQAFRDHPYWTYVLFVAMPFLIHPLWYWLVFGSYKANLPQVIAMAGMIKFLDCLRRAEEPAAAPAKEVDALGLAGMEARSVARGVARST